MKLKTLAAFAAIVTTAITQAQTPFFTEVYINPPGTDQTKETIELQGPANFSFANYFILVIEGEANTVKGNITARVSLNSMSAGSNGLLLIRDASNVFNPAPSAGTNVVVFDFNPDLQNDAETFVLGFGTPPALGTDLDAETLNAGDGILDAGALNGFTVVDAFSFKGSSATNAPLEASYAGQLGGTNLASHQGTNPLYSGTFTGTPDLFYRVLNQAQTAPLGWSCGDMVAPDAFAPIWDTDTTTTLRRAVTYVPGLTVPTFTASVNGPDFGVKNFGFAVSTVASISGNLTLLDTIGQSGTESITWTLDNGSASYTGTVSVADQGSSSYSFNVPSGATNGAYTLKFKGGTFLSKTLNVTLTGSSLSAQNASLKNGDIDQDGEVGPSDFDIVVAQFGGAGDADVDNDNEVGPSDFDIVVANFGIGDE